MKFTIYYQDIFEDKYQTSFLNPSYNNLVMQGVTGQLLVSFVDTDTKLPFSRLDRSDNNVKPYSFQLDFTSSDGSFSFKTSLFPSSYMVSNNFLTSSDFLKQDNSW